MADREEEEIKSEIANQQGNSGSDIDKEEIVKELKKVKRQNSVTHWLLSIMIFLTVAWQVSEVSLLLKVKDGIDHPFKFLGGMFNGMLKGSGSDEEENQQNLIEAPSLPTLKIPELPNMELADLSNNHEQH